PKVDELSRTSPQRRADALVEMATRSRTAPANGQRPAPLFSVLVGYETMHGRMCQLAQGTVVTPGSLIRWLDEAYVERAVFRPGNRTEISSTVRLFGGATRRAIELRDLECTHPYCDTPAPDCQVDHIMPAAIGGPTTQENGRLLCGFHNRLRNQRPPPAA
ncbi:MAG TPA: HNH endonuclease signature motif containing protein, partial [Acidimicrobiales bacterium]|nr:HNH endonuclease signature motif containing protein [Acidimicrobiales bacterium]